MSQDDRDQQAGMIPSGSRVVIVVSQGPNAARPGYVDVPQVTGLAQGNALTALQDAGLQARVVNDYSDDYARGKVMGQLPSAGSNVTLGAEVVLLVSSGKAAQYGTPMVLPDVVGMTETDAVSELQAARLSPQLVREYSPTVPAGIVMAQLPNESWLAGAPAKKQKWWIWIVAGLLVLAAALAAVYFLFPMTVQVPNVIGLTQTEAVRAIEAADLEVGDITQSPAADVKEGEVAAQGPRPSVRVRPGTEVDLIISSGEPLIEIPDLVGATQDQAIAVLRSAGLNTRTRFETTQTVEAGTVIETSPSAGESVPRGTTIGLVVAEAPKKPALTEVPDVSGFTAEDAQSTLADLGLKVVAVENPSTSVAEGVVITQLPDAGREVDPGTSVALLISSGQPTDTATISVPSLVGQTLANAQALLAPAGLRSQPVAIDGTNRNPTEVVGQAPKAGTTVPANSVILLLYAR